ncbi:uncharacterized protein TRAVEDRAFT_114206 [Trametes versicolor FP-101664 SS1]|uniref:uncharacterized protein n=1 Tax=Trametes versicolor (strain FP-101664) TaxID=717944 RepID=UPI0004622E43|nr:uncharacterized protein TRAVEDRAFT_114206 [Trametes versicolor FP-101664 SS1]EIW63618.1 hypothetical protein TRAVEDRAFT_114206 [Trametes versicolor FP-101664 SS1]
MRASKIKTFVVPFPGALAGAAVPDGTAVTDPTYAHYQSEVEHGTSTSPYAPFLSELDWGVARWAKARCGAGSTAFSDLLAVEGVAQRLALSYKNSRELNAIIDKLPTGRPRFVREEIVVAGEAFEVYFRDILECIRALLGDPEFAPLLLLVPEQHYTDGTKTMQVYFDMNTGKWWWATQRALEEKKPGATVIPVIISSDKTQLTLIGNKSAYPVYMTLGNLPKDIRCKPSRRGQILLAYLPTSRLLHISNKAARRRTLANLFHACMTRVLAPLATAGISGMHFASGDGVVRRGHPILATYVGDYPEQLLVMGGKNGECPKCTIGRNDLGRTVDTSRPFRNFALILDALAALDEGPLAFTKACAGVGIKPIHHPFWQDLPYTNIFASITPDILHQLYQGVIKHLISWVQDAYGAEEVDARCSRLPPNHSLRHFSKGISNLSRVTGKEHQDMSRILLGLIIGLPLPDGVSPSRLVRATRALLDFLYFAQYPTHTSATLKSLDDALASFHANKVIFQELGIRDHFKLPKLHSLEHYRRSIELFGTTDNYDTQYSERLHIDFAKDAYRATNHKDEFAQMTVWLERKEKVDRHEKYILWRLSNAAATPSPMSVVCEVPLRIVMTRHPSVKAVTFENLISQYGATFFRDALARFVVIRNQPTLTPAQVELASGSVYFNFRAVPVYHKIKFAIEDILGLGTSRASIEDVAHVRPARKGKYDIDVAARHDTVLVRAPNDDGRDVICFRVAQVRVVFQLPEKAKEQLFPLIDPGSRPRHLAYVEWFAPFGAAANPHPDHGLHRVARSVRQGARLASVIAVDEIERSCHLFPEFGSVAARQWTSANVLEECPSFFLNTFVDRYTYMLVHR